jgi:aminoglycoside phosphotransferase (APT) family kinase protein
MSSMPSDHHGPLLGRGRSADVYELGGGRVLRRYRTDQDCVPEAELIRHLHRHGYPVPEVHDADGTDIVMERIEGVVQIDDLKQRPWLLRTHARTLASLHRRLDAVPVPEPSPVPAVDAGRGVLHLDLHPGNVILSPSGPVVIDWSNARIGERSGDVATTWMLLATGAAPGGRIERIAAAVLRRRMLAAFLAAVDAGAAGRRLAVVCARRLEDPNVRVDEVAAVRLLAGSADG